jgi:hypothetical protein
MTFGHGGNIYEVARHLDCQPSEIIESLKQSIINQMLANRLKAIVKKAESVLTAGRIAC